MATTNREEKVDSQLLYSSMPSHTTETPVQTVTAIDFETTGLDFLRGDRIVEVGALKWSDHELIGVYESFVAPGKEMPEAVIKVTGITDKMLEGAPAAATVIPELLDFIEDDTLIMHNVTFDSGFLKAHLRDLSIEKEYRFFDTLTSARKRFPGSPNYRLATLKNYLQLVPSGVMHRALSDAYVTLQLYLKLENLWGVDTKSRLEKQLKQLLEKKKSGARFCRR